jgi:putative transposase
MFRFSRSSLKRKRMQDHQDRIVAALMEQLIETGPDGMAQVFTAVFNLAMRLEREQHLGAALHERSEGRRGYANGYKPKTVDTPAGSVSLRVPKSRGCEAPFFPQSLERGRRSSRAVMLAIAQMYVQGVSTRDAAKVMAEFGLEGLSSTQVSRAAALLDDELEAWRTRELGQVRYLVLDARYEKVRDGGVVRDAAILSAVGVAPEGRRRILGVSVALSEAEAHWRAFLDSLIERGMRGVEFVVSDDHAGLRAARRAVLPGATWQRCQFHLAQNAIHHAPSLTIRKQIGAELRSVWNARDLQAAEAELRRLVESYADKAPKLASWLETNVSEGLAVLSLPEHHRRRMRTSNPIERAVNQEIKRRTLKVRVFPNEASLLRLVTAVLVEIDEEWATTDRVYINMEDRNG